MIAGVVLFIVSIWFFVLFYIAFHDTIHAQCNWDTIEHEDNSDWGSDYDDIEKGGIYHKATDYIIVVKEGGIYHKATDYIIVDRRA